MLEEFKANLLKLKPRLEEIERKYKKQIDAAESTGFMVDYVEQLKEKQWQLSNKIEALKSLIDRQNMKIGRHEQIIKRLKYKASRP
jgi:hypothetical protein